MKRFMLSAIVPLIAAFGIALTPAMPASATSAATCVTQDVPWPCVQVFGTGVFVVAMNGWANNATNAQIDNLHIELHRNDPTTGQNVIIKKCAPFNLPPGANSANCNWAPNHTELAGRYCADVKQAITSTTYRNLGTSCVSVHS